MINDIYLGATGSEILLDPFGRELSIDTIDTAKEERTVDGTMKWDVMYTKHEFTLAYDLITGTALSTYETILALTQPLSLKIYTAVGVSDDYSVYFPNFNRTRFRLTDDGLWKGVTIKLVEA